MIMGTSRLSVLIDEWCIRRQIIIMHGNPQFCITSTVVLIHAASSSSIHLMLMPVTYGASIGYLGKGAGVFLVFFLNFAWPFLFISQERWKLSFIFFTLRIGCISTNPCGHLFIPSIFPTKIFISKKIQWQPPPPGPPYSNGGPLTVTLLSKV